MTLQVLLLTNILAIGKKRWLSRFSKSFLQPRLLSSSQSCMHAKLFDVIIVDEINSFFENGGFFGDEQFGCHKVLNSKMIALDLIKNIRLTFDVQDLYLIAFVDFFVAIYCLFSSHIFALILARSIKVTANVCMAESPFGLCLRKVFGRGYWVRDFYYNVWRRDILFVMHTRCTCHTFADNKTTEIRCRP